MPVANRPKTSLADYSSIQNNSIQQGISGNEAILVRDGVIIRKVKMEDLANQHRPVQVLSFDPSDLSYSWQPLIELHRHENTHSLVRIRTRSGRETSVLATHPFPSVDDDGNLVNIQGRELIPGRSLLLIPGTIPNTRAWSWVVVHEPVIGPKKGLQIDLPHALRLSTDLGFLFGRYLANGASVDRQGAFYIASINEKLEHLTLSILSEIGTHPHLDQGTIRVSSAQLARSLENDFGRIAADKKIPGWTFGAPVRFRMGLIDGFWSSGWIEPKGRIMQVQTYSRELAQDMQAFLASIHVQTYLRERDYEYASGKSRKQFRIEISSSGVGRMPVLSHPEKRAKQKKWVPPQKDMLDVAPIPKNLVKGKLRSKSEKGYGGVTFVTREATHPRHRRLLDSPILWDVVESVTEMPPQESVYSLTIDTSHSIALYLGITLSGCSS